MLNGVSTIPFPGEDSAPAVGFERKRTRPSSLREFVAGPENRLAVVAVQSLLTDVRVAKYNPLVFCGPPGTGKSHLARGLVRAWKKRRPGQRLVCLTGAEFAGQYAAALDAAAANAWRTRLAGLDLFVLEDVGQLTGKLSAQYELWHLLDDLLDRGAAVVATSRLAPRKLTGILPGLQSRLSAGLVVPLEPPGSEARAVLVRKMAALRRLPLAEPAAAALAKSLAATVPELAGALAHLELLRSEQSPRPGGAAGNQGEVNREMVRAYLDARAKARQVSLPTIAARTAHHFSLSVADLKSPSRRQAVVLARGVAMHLARQLAGKSLKQIGRYFGDRDHTTVLHGCRKTEELLETDAGVAQAALELRRTLEVG